NEAWEENRLSVFYTAQKPGSETEKFIGKMTIDVSKKGSPLGYDHLRVPCNGNFEPDQKFQLFFKRDAKTSEPTLEIYHSIPTNPTRFKFTTWDLQKKSLEFDKTVEAFETIENHKKVHSLKWQGSYYTVKTRMVDSKVIRPTEPEIEPYYYLHERDGELGWLLPKKSNGNPDGEEIVQLQLVFNCDNFESDERFIFAFTKSWKYAIVKYGHLRSNIKHGVDLGPADVWKTVVDMTKINGGAVLTDYTFPTNIRWRYQPRAQRITAKGPLHLDIFNALDKDEATVSIERHSKFSRIDERYLSAWDQKFNLYAVHVEGTNWVEVISEQQLYIPLSQVEEDGCIDGWDLAAVNGHVFLLTHTRLYHFDTITIKIDVLALPVKGVTKGPRHRMFTTTYHLEAIDGRRRTVDIVVAVDDLLILYAVSYVTNQLACLQMHNPGVGRITALAPGRDFWVAGRKGIARLVPNPTHVYSVPNGDRICLHNGNLVRYPSAYTYRTEQLDRPGLPEGPYACLLDANTEKMFFLLLTNNIHRRQCVYLELSQYSPSMNCDMVCDAPVFMATIDYERYYTYHTPVFWYFDNDAIKPPRPKANLPFRFISISRHKCQIFIYMEGGFSLPRGTFNPQDLPADSAPDFKVVKVACIITPLINRIIVATEHFLLMETHSGHFEVHVIDKLSRFNQASSEAAEDVIPADNMRGRKIVDMTDAVHCHDIIVLLECGYVVHYEWGHLTLTQVAYRQSRWKSLNGMSLARSFLGMRHFGSSPSTKVFGYAERILDDDPRGRVIGAVFRDDEVLVEHLQDLRETASLSRDLWNNDDRYQHLLLSLQSPKSLRDVSLILPMISRTYLRAPLITYKIEKIVAEPMDEFGFSLLAVIGTGLTLIVYQPELEKLTVLNEHFPRYPCVDVAFSMVRKVEVEGKTCIRGFIILATEADIELLDFLFKGDPTVKDWATKQPVGTPQAPILRRMVMNVGPRICKLYVPTTYETLRHQQLAIFYVACCPKNERDFFIGALVVTEAPLSKKPGVKPQMRRSHERIPCVGTFQPGQEFQLMLKRIPDVVCPTVQIYYRLSTDPDRFKFGTWDLKAKTLVFDKEVAAFESFEDNGKIYSLKWQGSYYSVKTRLVDPKRQLSSAAESAITPCSTTRIRCI
ncbi:unnamed protein product, partial [Mesorhabditis spiculigera]